MLLASWRRAFLDALILPPCRPPPGVEKEVSRESFTVPPSADPEPPAPSGQMLGVSSAVLPET